MDSTPSCLSLGRLADRAGRLWASSLQSRPAAGHGDDGGLRANPASQRNCAWVQPDEETYEKRRNMIWLLLALVLRPDCRDFAVQLALARLCSKRA